MILISWRRPFFVVFAIDSSEKRPEFPAKTFFSVVVINSAKKRPEFLAKIFFLVFAIDSSENRPEFRAKTFLFWSSGMVAAHWNHVGTECGPLVQKVADPWSKPIKSLYCTYCTKNPPSLTDFLKVRRRMHQPRCHQ